MDNEDKISQELARLISERIFSTTADQFDYSEFDIERFIVNNFEDIQEIFNKHK